MVARAEVPHSSGSGELVLRRVIARVVDDGLLTGLSILIALGINRLVSPSRAASEFTPGIDIVTAGETATVGVLLTGLLATMLFLFYVGNAAGRRGATIGRLATGIRVVAHDGGRLPASVVFGRELTRVALVCLSLAIVHPVADALGRPFLELAANPSGEAASLIVTTVTVLVPVCVVIAGWIGAALLDPRGRAPHDRLARSAVVRASAAPTPGD